MRTLILLCALFFTPVSMARTATGEQLAQCSGHYFAAGIMTAIEGDDENKIYYTLLALMTSTRSYNLIGYERSRQITNSIIGNYGAQAKRATDITRSIITNTLRCDKILSG